MRNDTFRESRAVDLHPEEPEAGPWRMLDDEELAALVRRHLPTDRPALVLVDGRSGGGKSTIAERIAELLDGGVVHTDDVAWNHAMFDWADSLVAGVLGPWAGGEDVRYRPPGWEVHDREGSVEAAAGRALVVEGVGAARESLAARADLVVWVQSDRTLARSRGIARDASYGTRTPAEVEAFWDGWMSEEEPFLGADRPWERADVVVLGTPPDALSDSRQIWVAVRGTLDP